MANALTLTGSTGAFLVSPAVTSVSGGTSFFASTVSGPAALTSQGGPLSLTSDSGALLYTPASGGLSVSVGYPSAPLGSALPPLVPCC